MDMKNFKIIDNDGKYFIDNNGNTLKAVSLGLTKDEKGSLCELFIPEIFLNAVARLPVLDNDKLPFFQEKSNRETDMQTEEKNRGLRIEQHNLSRDEIVDVLFYKAKEFYNTKENSMPSSLVIDEIAVDSFGDHYCNDILYVWISLHRTVKSAVIALLGKERYKSDKLFDYKSACIEISKEDVLRLRKINEPIEGVNNYASVAIID